jgi:ketosteroid isomerase-like protein
MKAIFVPVCFLGILTFAAADSIQSVINATSEAVCKAMKARDFNAFNAAMKDHVTPDFKYFEGKGAKPLTYDQMVDGMKKGLAAFTKMTIVDTKILNVKTAGDTATIISSHHMVGMVPGADKKSHVMAFSGTTSDVYKKVGGAWKEASMTWVTQESRLDGHLQKAGKM